MARAGIDWESIIFREIESEELDYKAAQNWQDLSRAAKAKFARHCLAMANSKGGYIVVGVGEDKGGRPRLRTGLTERQLKSFDPTAVGNFINRFADPAIDFDIERPVVDGKRYAIFVIRRFASLPHVCSYGCDTELQQGVFYIRTADASSRPAYRSSEIHSIVQRALRNQRELLGRMLRGILYENRQYFEPDSEGYFADQLHNSRKLFFARTPNDVDKEKVLLEITVYPADFEEERFGLSEVRSAVENSTYTFADPRFIVNDDVDESFMTNVSVRCLRDGRTKFWQAFQSGMFHYMNYLVGDSAELKYGDLVQIVTEAVFFLGQFYLELGQEDELLSIRFKLSGVEGTELVGSEAKSRKSGKKSQYICRIPDIKVSLQRTVADLASGPATHSSRFIMEICERFNLSDGRHNDLETRIEELLSASGRTSI